MSFAEQRVIELAPPARRSAGPRTGRSARPGRRAPCPRRARPRSSRSSVAGWVVAARGSACGASFSSNSRTGTPRRAEQPGAQQPDRSAAGDQHALRHIFVRRGHCLCRVLEWRLRLCQASRHNDGGGHAQSEHPAIGHRPRHRAARPRACASTISIRRRPRWSWSTCRTPSCCPASATRCARWREKIVPNINRLARAVRQTGGTVVWIKTHFTEEALKELVELFRHALRPEREGQAHRGADAPAARAMSCGPRSKWSREDLIVEKKRFSAFIQGSSDLRRCLRARGIDTMLITGTVTNVCCEIDGARRHDAEFQDHHGDRRQCRRHRRGSQRRADRASISPSATSCRPTC